MKTERQIHSKHLLILNPHNMRNKAFIRGLAIVAVIGLSLGALLPVFANL